MTDRAVLKEKNSNNKNGESHHGPPHLSQKEEKDSKSKSTENNEIDTFLKRYKIMEKIGEGSYSEVLKCQNRHDGTLVACKRLKHIYKSWADVNNIAEIATLRTIPRHSNILQMIEIHYPPLITRFIFTKSDECLGKVSLVFELMDVNLYELIKDRKRLLPESRVRTIMFQLFRALRHLHKLGIFHRDIKPENILIRTKTDQLKLGDLGSVRGMFSRPPYTEYISTRWYRSPECLLTAGHYSHKMDVWAAGCVFYEVLTLRPLFPGSSEIDQINRINNILGPPPIKLLETFQKQAEMEKDTYRGQSQLNRRQQIQKVLDDYSSKYMITNEGKTSSNKSIKTSSRNTVEYHFSGKEGSGLEKILPTHISREAKEIIKACLSYDPEMRPTAQRIIQLSYFYELRESYYKNPEKISSKPVLTICGETVTEQQATIDLGTLGDNKMKYRRGHHSHRSTKQSTSSYLQPKANSKIAMIDKKLSMNKDLGNNHSKNSSSPNENSPMSQNRSHISNSDVRGLNKNNKALNSQTFHAQKERKPSLVDVRGLNENSKVLHSQTFYAQKERNPSLVDIRGLNKNSKILNSQTFYVQKERKASLIDISGVSETSKVLNSPTFHAQKERKPSVVDVRGLNKNSKVLNCQTLHTQKERKPSLVDINNNKIQKTSRVTVNQAETETVVVTKIPMPKVRSKHYHQTKRNRKESTTTSSSFESVHNFEKKYKYKFNPSSVTKSVEKTGSFLMLSQKEPIKGSSTGLTNFPADIQLSPYVKAPSELKFLQKKIKGDQAQGKKPIVPTQSSLSQNRGSVVPAKVAAAAIRFAKVHAKNHHHYHHQQHQTSSVHNRHAYNHHQPPEETRRSTMRDDVFCSSDDDVIISMRKKFDTLISERARRLSESLKSNPVVKERTQGTRKYYDSDEDITPEFNPRFKHNSNEKARKYARRELRARMAESLTMNNIYSHNWRMSEYRARPVLIENPSNNCGDYVVAAAASYNKDQKPPEEKKKPVDLPSSRLSFQRSGSFFRTRKDANDGGFRDKYQPSPHQPLVSSRIYPYSRQDQNSRHGLYTPPGNKPVYQPPYLGTILHDRKLRYSHNLPVPISNSQSNYNQSPQDRNIKENLKKRQRI